MALRSSSTRALDREIGRLALPALGALIAEPLFLLTDTALVGHLGGVPLAGLGLAGTVLHTTIGLLVFLAYATTPLVARRLGAGDARGAVRAGIDGLWLALGLGLLVALGGLLASAPLLALFGADAAVTQAATEYLLVSLIGIPAMLLVIAATGLLRGLQDTRTPLIVAGAGFAANAALNALFLYGFGWGLAGSAAGTVLAQWGMAAVYLVIAVRAARAAGAPLRPGLGGVLRTAMDGGWMLLRTVSLRIAVLAPVVVAAGLGTAELGALQIAMTLTSTLAFALDALAIAGQAMIGHGLGSGDADRVRAVTRRLKVLGVGGGIALGAVLALASPVLGAVFTSDAAVLALLPPLLLVLAIGTPLAGFAYVLDGVLIGAGDARYLAIAGVVNVLVFLPLLALLGTGSLLALWAAFTFGYQGVRALTLGLRARGEGWMRLGA